MKRRLQICAAAAVLLVAVSGCAELGITPPFDVTGVFRGAWEGTVQGAADGERSCAVTFDLKQDSTYQLFQGFGVTGEATVYFACASMIDDIAESGLPSRVTLTVQGFLLPDGRIAFASIEPGATQSVLISVSGSGHDNDDSGTMDRINGDWNLAIDQPGHPRITIRGTVDAGTD